MIIETKTINPNIFNHQYWIKEIDPEVIKVTFETILIQSGFKIVKFDDYYFPVKGYTCFWLLAESHLAIHTFPDDQCSYVELSSCNEEKLSVFKSLIQQ
ncbi:S-adenosylmethionine decarboxylase [Aquimarina longa]|uniref:S-adenosylmethionine decarboxylase n=1 Tax=Aquimarina longa TaxID=1080221 RepID=UPI0007802AF0|nr:S-adenosylmethionine decarboxylase [Aquimarina longa]